MVILESVKSAHKSVSYILSSFSEHANDGFKENSSEEHKAFIETLVASCFVELENHECMKVVMEILWNFSPYTWWTQQTTKLFTLETFVVYGKSPNRQFS